jgi:hypothetical protein
VALYETQRALTRILSTDITTLIPAIQQYSFIIDTEAKVLKVSNFIKDEFVKTQQVAYNIVFGIPNFTILFLRKLKSNL